MTYYKDTLQAFLDNHIHEILGKLGREFDSNDFITAFRLFSPMNMQLLCEEAALIEPSILGLPDGIFPARPIDFKKAIFGRGKATTAIRQKITRGSNFNTLTIWAENS